MNPLCSRDLNRITLNRSDDVKDTDDSSGKNTSHDNYKDAKLMLFYDYTIENLLPTMPL